MNLLELMQEMPIFSRFSEDEKKMFAAMDYPLKTYAKGDAIIREGENTSALFLLLKGIALVTKTDDNTHIRIAKIKPGELFGEMSFFHQNPRKSNVIANDEVLVLQMDDDFFNKVHPDIKDKIKDYLLFILVNRLDQMNSALMRISKLMHA